MPETMLGEVAALSQLPMMNLWGLLLREGTQKDGEWKS